MRYLLARLTTGNLALAATGALLTLIAAYASVRMGAQIGLAAVLVAFVYLSTVLAYLRAPHIAIAATVLLFPLVPALKVFLTPQIGAVKDIVSLGAITAAAVFFIFDRRRPDRWVGILVTLLLAVYVINPGGGHGAAWATELRLAGEPLLLLLVGSVLPRPERNLRYALYSLLAVGCAIALYGLLQQVVGQYTLVSWGYAFGTQVRTISGMLRSFGTLDDPFEYAAFLTFALAAAAFWLRRGTIAWSAGALLLAGLAVSFVRTAALIVLAFTGILLLRRRQLVPATCLVLAALIVAAVALLNASGTQTTSYTIYTAGGQTQVVTSTTPSSNGSLNGRISAWSAALGSDPLEWLLGRGAGTVGTAAARAASSFIPSGNSTSQRQAVDSGYLETIADVGLAGLVVQLALFGRLIALAVRSARRGLSAGWFALALIAAMMLDALTRASFTAFPTAFVGLILVGVAVAGVSNSRGPMPGDAARI